MNRLMAVQGIIQSEGDEIGGYTLTADTEVICQKDSVIPLYFGPDYTVLAGIIMGIDKVTEGGECFWVASGVGLPVSEEAQHTLPLKLMCVVDIARHTQKEITLLEVEAVFIVVDGTSGSGTSIRWGVV